MFLQYVGLHRNEAAAKDALSFFLDDFLIPVIEDLSHYSTHLLQRKSSNAQAANDIIQSSLHELYEVTRQIARSGITFSPLMQKKPRLR